MCYDQALPASILYASLQAFFAAYPEFQKNEFYIAGESYAGVYIPTLAMQVPCSSATVLGRCGP